MFSCLDLSSGFRILGIKFLEVELLGHLKYVFLWSLIQFAKSLLYACVYTRLCVVYGGLCLCMWCVCDVWYVCGVWHVSVYLHVCDV